MRSRSQVGRARDRRRPDPLGHGGGRDCLGGRQAAIVGYGIADLGKRLNVALAQRGQELLRYRSEFFGKLHEILGDHPDIRVVGDRFVFQSELFLNPAGARGVAAGRPRGT
jgi:hypothetical protein